MPTKFTKSRCLIMGCSQTKRESPELLPAIQRYDGPPFRVLRRYLNHQPDHANKLDVFILSAKYGLINGQKTIADYDQRMTRTRALKLQSAVADQVRNCLSPMEYETMFISMGKTYLHAIAGIENLVNQDTQITISNVSSGKQLTLLKNWLWEKELTATKCTGFEFVEAKTKPQTVILRGCTVTLTTTEALEKLKAGIYNDVGNSHQIRRWYIDIDSKQISPKWAAQYLFDLPVNLFSADEARRALRQLGLNCVQKEKSL